MSKLLFKETVIAKRWPWQRLARSAVHCSSSAAERANSYKQGEKIHGYTVKKVVPVPELYLTAVSLTHDKTGAQHLHVAREDKDNVFGVGFRTTPMDDTGVPHILEHTVLCGSQKYPVRDPFFKMLNRSLSTFMNAFTSSDWTMYPFSSQNDQDFKNLMSVYLDAVFFPRLREMDFRQEGWRLEHEDPQDNKSPIVFKGVVFNEMKGVFSSAQSIFSQKTQNLLMPSHTYSTCYGGDPPSIPKLTWEHLKDFHASHYHPSNSRFFTYGSFPLEEHLSFIDSHALNKFEKINPGTEVPLEKKWTQPREAEIDCNFDPMYPDPNKQTTVAVNWLMGDVTDAFESFTLSLLGHLLAGSEKSPFYQALIESNIGSDFAPEHGYCNQTREGKFSIGLQLINKDDVNKVKSIIDETVDKVIRDGFEKQQIESVLHQVELSIKDQKDKFGLGLGVQIMYSWNHDADPTGPLMATQHTEKFKECLRKNPRFLQEKVEEYFKKNPHKLTLVMSPNEAFEAKRQEEEKKLLDGMVSGLSEQDKKSVYDKGLELLQLQSQEEDLSCLPTLKVSDIDRKVEPVKMDYYHIDGTPIYHTAQPTNGVTYFRAVSSIAGLPEDLVPYVPLFCGVVTRMGAGKRDFRELAQEIELKTGGLSAKPHVTDHHSSTKMLEQGVQFSSLCLEKNTEAMFNLWSDIFHSLNTTDIARLKQLIAMQSTEMANSIVMSGHLYAVSHSSSSLSASSKLAEVFSGMTQVSLLKTIAEMEIDDLGHVVQNLKDIAHHVLNRHTMRCSINATPDAMEMACQETEKFVKELFHPDQEKPEKLDLEHLHFYNEDTDFVSHQRKTHIELPFQVNYMAQSMTSTPYTDPDFASLRVLGKLMTSKFLHREIREKGGAYGGGAMSRNAGMFSFFSYRDPNSVNTLDAFERAIQWAIKGDFTQQDIDEAKLGIFQQVDMPVTPGGKGQRRFLYDITDDMFQNHREQLFEVSKESLMSVTQKYLSPENRTSSVSFLGPENQMSSGSKEWTVKKQH